MCIPKGEDGAPAYHWIKRSIILGGPARQGACHAPSHFDGQKRCNGTACCGIIINATCKRSVCASKREGPNANRVTNGGRS